MHKEKNADSTFGIILCSEWSNHLISEYYKVSNQHLKKWPEFIWLPLQNHEINLHYGSVLWR